MAMMVLSIFLFSAGLIGFAVFTQVGTLLLREMFAEFSTPVLSFIFLLWIAIITTPFMLMSTKERKIKAEFAKNFPDLAEIMR